MLTALLAFMRWFLFDFLMIATSLDFFFIISRRVKLCLDLLFWVKNLILKWTFITGSWLSRILGIHKINGFTLEAYLMNLGSSFIQVSQILWRGSNFFFRLLDIFCIRGWLLLVWFDIFILITGRLILLFAIPFLPLLRVFISVEHNGIVGPFHPCLTYSLRRN